MKFFKNLFIFTILILVAVGNIGCAVSTGDYAFAVGIPVRGTISTAPMRDCYGRPFGGSFTRFETGVPTIESTQRTRRVVYEDGPSSVYQQNSAGDDIDVIR